MNKEEVDRKEYHKEYNRRPEVQERRNKNWTKYRNPENHNARAKAYAEKHPDKIKARNTSKLIKIPKGTTCFYCPNLAVEKHHEDYSKPKIVTFVCRKCHTKLRRKE